MAAIMADYDRIKNAIARDVHALLAAEVQWKIYLHDLDDFLKGEGSPSKVCASIQAYKDALRASRA